MALTVSGLSGSGIDVSSLVSQLMAAESVPQQNLITKQATLLTTETSWASLNTSLAAVTDAVTAMATPAAASAATVSSSNTSRATVTATGTVTPQSVTFQISQLAAAQQLASAPVASSNAGLGDGSLLLSSGTGQVGISNLSVDSSQLADGNHTLIVTQGATAGGTAQVTLDGTAYNVAMDGNPVSIGGLTFTPGSALTAGTVNFTNVTSNSQLSLTQLAANINTFGGPAAAAALSVNGDGAGQLVLTAANTGTAGAVTVTGTGALASMASGMTTNRQAQNAVIQMGSLTVTRSSNNITDLIPGATIQLLQADPPGTVTGQGTDVTVGVAMDPNGVGTKAQNLVNALNGVFSEVGSLTSYDTTSNTGGPLFGDSRPGQLTNDLYSAMNSVTGSGQTATLSQIGIQVQRDGTYTFDSGQLASQLASDPQGTLSLLSKAANAVAKVQQAATGTLTTTGWISIAQQGAQANVTDVTNQISAWNDRLAQLQQQYTTQYTNLDVAVSTLKQQGTWLTSQLANLITG